MSPEVALNRISPALRPFISNVVRNGKIGLDATNNLKITDLKSGCTSLTPGPCCDRFKLHIPYAGETLKWDIIFNCHYPDLPPDFIFGEDVDFLPEPTMLHTGEFSARFLLKLPVDFSNIPTYLLKDTVIDPGEDVALLSVSFEDTEATQVFPKLYLSPRIEQSAGSCSSQNTILYSRHGQIPRQYSSNRKKNVDFKLDNFHIASYFNLLRENSSALGGTSALHIPPFPSGGCLIDYVPQVCQLLTNKVQYIIQGYHRRREYIAAFLSHFGTGVVEYDAEGFTKLTLLLMWKDFCFLVHIDLPLYFPRDQPTLTFQSVYHFTNSGQLYQQIQKSYPYSPRWDGNEMAKRAKAYFKTYVPQFQEAAFANGKL
ncbi:BRISC and BRCA1-A complex member 2 isoform X3 [Carcharodon carcharias]|uniref:BRISC and BRCA1-A complex member 2 isoform X3 n=1 Tax=Carcharodon carcharias TaxID=13397 RepID=UPI001B7E13DF|nr:BRISC and BRCA1-A complex member 2 isoform X3 [Carcharodon carcharias]